MLANLALKHGANKVPVPNYLQNLTCKGKACDDESLLSLNDLQLDMSDLVAEMKDVLNDVSTTEFSSHMYADMISELNGVPEIVEELKRKAKSYQQLVNAVEVDTGHKTIGKKQEE